MMRSLFSGVSGLKSHQTRMDVIGNNIANINTAGFKSSRVTFSDMLSQTSSGASKPTNNIGGTNAKQIGLGAQVASVDMVFSDGSTQTTGKNTDVVLSGNGLFVLKRDGSYYYSRDGAFEFDANGNYVLPGSGLRVQGWNAVDGVLNTNAATEDVNVKAGKTMGASATSTVDYSGNLDAGALSITKITTTPGGSSSSPDSVQSKDSDGTVTKVNVDGTNVIAATLTLSDGSTMSVSSGFYQVGESVPVTTVVTVYDSEGHEHAITLLLDKDTSSFDSTMNQDALDLASYYTKGSYKVTGYDSVATSTSVTGTGTDTKVNDIYIVQGAGTTITDNSDNTIAVPFTNSDTTLAGVNSHFVYTDGTGTDTKVYNLISCDGVTTNTVSGSTTYQFTNPVWANCLDATDTNTTFATTTATGSPAVQTGYAGADPYWGNRWRAYIAPEKGQQGPATQYFVTETDGSTTSGTLNPSSDTATGHSSFIYFTDNGAYSAAATQSASMTLNYADGNGAAATTFAVNFDGLTQYTGNTTAYGNGDGNAYGVLQSISIDGSGIITGTYTNGVIRNEAQIAAAQFINTAGLNKVGTSLYQESNNSGVANVKTIDALGLSVQASALEMSNVDLASELSDMIITQRGFQSNSKIITTSDEMLETLINMKR